MKSQRTVSSGVSMRELYKTDIEKIMEKALNKKGIEAVYNFPFRSRYGYILDFAIPEQKICIECDGEHWHKEGNSRDRKRNWVMRKQGWKIIRFRGKEIKEDIDSCLKNIQKEVENDKN